MRTHYPEHRPGFCSAVANAWRILSSPWKQDRRSSWSGLAFRPRLNKPDVRCENCRSSTTRYSGNPRCCCIKQCEISERAETTYLNIIGGMLTLMLSQSPQACLFQLQTQEALVSALVAHYGGTMGITERTLNGKFANNAKRYVRSASA